MQVANNQLGSLEVGRWYPLARCSGVGGRPRFKALAGAAGGTLVRLLDPRVFGKEWGQGLFLDALMRHADPRPGPHLRREVRLECRRGGKKSTRTVDWVLADDVLVEQEWSQGMKKAVKQIQEWRRDSPWKGPGIAIATRGKTGEVDGTPVWRFLLQFGLDSCGRVVARLTTDQPSATSLGRLARPEDKGRSVSEENGRPAGSVEATAEVLYQADGDGQFVALPCVRLRLNVNGGNARATRWLEFWDRHGGGDVVLLHEPVRQRRTWTPGRGVEQEPERKARSYAIWRVEGYGVPLGAAASAADMSALAEQAWREQAPGLTERALAVGSGMAEFLPREREAHELALRALQRAVEAH
jgi:hypothetical protein